MRNTRELIHLIQDGCFSHHISITPKPNYVPFQDIWIRSQTKMHHLLQKYYTHLEKNTEHRVVYRGLRLSHLSSPILHHPLPFSTSQSLQFAKEWVSFTNVPTNVFVVLCIYLPKNIPVLPLETNDCEEEINLPPGQLILTRRLSQESSITMYSCKYIPYSKDDIITYFKDMATASYE